MVVAIGSDHNGYTLKSQILQFVADDGHEVHDLGPYSADPVDYPLVALDAATGLKAGYYDCAILVCATGVSMAIAANKVPGVYAAACNDPDTAVFSREANDARVLTLGAWLVGPRRARAIVRAWLGSRFQGHDSARTVDEIRQIEEMFVDREKIQRFAMLGATAQARGNSCLSLGKNGCQRPAFRRRDSPSRSRHSGRAPERTIGQVYGDRPASCRR